MPAQPPMEARTKLVREGHWSRPSSLWAGGGANQFPSFLIVLVMGIVQGLELRMGHSLSEKYSVGLQLSSGDENVLNEKRALRFHVLYIPE